MFVKEWSSVHANQYNCHNHMYLHLLSLRRWAFRRWAFSSLLSRLSLDEGGSGEVGDKKDREKGTGAWGQEEAASAGTIEKFGRQWYATHGPIIPLGRSWRPPWLLRSVCVCIHMVYIYIHQNKYKYIYIHYSAQRFPSGSGLAARQGSLVASHAGDTDPLPYPDIYLGRIK